MGLNDLPTLAEINAERRAPQKGLPPVLAKKERKQTKEALGKAFRDAVWDRDKGRCRATKKKLQRTGTTDWDHLGEVDHSIPRSLAPERMYDTSNGLLLTKTLNRLRKVSCADAPEHRLFDYTGPDDRSLPQTFVWRDKTGRITKTRVG